MGVGGGRGAERETRHEVRLFRTHEAYLRKPHLVAWGDPSTCIINVEVLRAHACGYELKGTRSSTASH